MPYLIAVLVFIFIIILFIPSTWFEANMIRRRLLNAPKEVRVKGKLSIKRLTPIAINLMTLLNIKIPMEKRREIEKRLQLGGQEGKLSLEDLITLKVLLGLFFPVYILFLGAVSGKAMLIYLAIFTLPVGFLAPDQWLKSKVKKRQAQIRRELPYVLNAIAVMSEAGLNLMPAMQEFARKEDGELAKELKKVTQDVSVGDSQVKALERMGERCQVDEVNRFISTLSQSIERGASGITKVLRDQAAEVWEERKKNAQHLGEQASMKLFFPLLVLALPATAIFILGPAILSIIEFLISS
jgi:tight adherence protein C